MGIGGINPSYYINPNTRTLTTKLDNAAKSKYFGTDTSKDFMGNRMTYTQNAKDYYEPEASLEAKVAYEKLKANNQALPENEKKFCGTLSAPCIGFLPQGMGEPVENEKYRIEYSPDDEGMLRIYNKELDTYTTINPSKTYLQIDLTTGKSYLMEYALGGITNFLPVDGALQSVLQKFLGVEEIAAKPLDNAYVVTTDPLTGIEVMKVKGAEGGTAWYSITSREQEERLQELANIYRKKYPNLVTSDELARGMAIGEVCGHTVRTENGILQIACNGLGYMDENDPFKSWGFHYPLGEWGEIYNDIMKAIADHSIEGGIEDGDGWEKWFIDNGIAYEYSRLIVDDEQ